ncbi:hypothetical protein [uncultured Fusobacterium sp.]|uniref:hypothetical protein n=1 Tax=uncultured Fusobacterium sp. TaxID=159267 RepID=UPI0026148B7C|nr:hypothetical protein [uncultured Fusobacterium sp.]
MENNILEFKKIDRIIEQVFNSETPQIILEEELDTPFENLKNQSKKLKDIKEQIEKTLKKAEIAKENVREAGTDEERSFWDKANPFSKSSIKILIDKMQEATYNLSEVIINLTENQTIFWDYLKTLSEITKFLFDLGIANITINNMVVKYLEKKLSDASKEELDDLAREELENVVKRLKKQQEIESKYEEFKTEIKKELYDNRETINDFSNKITYIFEELKNLKKENKNLEIKKLKEKKDSLKETEEETDETRSMKFLYTSLGISIVTLIIVIISFILKLK